MVEALIAVGLIAVAAGTVLTAVLAVQHQTAATPSAQLLLSAQNVLTDLRASTAYDQKAIRDIAGRSVEFDATEPQPGGSPQPFHVLVRVTSTGNASPLAVVTVSNRAGRSVTLQSALAQEAPAPGFVVPADEPAAKTAP